jgi:hypothetical protein
MTVNHYLLKFIELLESKKIKVKHCFDGIFLKNGHRKIEIVGQPGNPTFPIHLIAGAPEKFAANLQAKLGLNETLFARKCELKKIRKLEANKFLDTYHLLNNANSPYNYGLFYEDALVSVASFSKGRKMNRLPEGKRSFELVRFCSKGGLTITGGLSKFLKHFCEEKQAGDIMTYVDKQFSDGASFIKAGFKKHSETPPLDFAVNKKTYERINISNTKQTLDSTKYYLLKNSGNVKLVYTPD